jgi:hypothetical protein
VAVSVAWRWPRDDRRWHQRRRYLRVRVGVKEIGVGINVLAHAVRELTELDRLKRTG